MMRKRKKPEFCARVLLSQDRGWWNVGEPGGGKVLDFNYLSDTFLPALAKSGVSKNTIRALTIDNPARAFAV
jgi:phosphotriesterase-related protein